MHRRIAAVAVAVLTAVPVLRAHPTDPPPRIDEAVIGEDVGTIIERERAEHGIPGMSVSVWVGDGIAFSDAWGEAVVEHGVPATRDTRFRLASVAKAYTGSLCARLAERGVLDLDADVRTYVPGFPEKEHVVTTRQLLAHLGGIRHYFPKDRIADQPGGVIDRRDYPDAESALAIFADDPLIFEPGTTEWYSTFAFTLIAAAVEGATGEAFMDVLDAEILSPLGLDDTRDDAWLEIVPNRTGFYDRADGPDSPLRHAQPMNAAYKIAGGGLLATADDMVRFGAAHLEGRVVGNEMLEVMWTPQRKADGTTVRAGLAWRRHEADDGRYVMHHSGAQSGARSVLAIWPEDRVVVAILSNLSSTPRDMEVVLQEIAALVLDRE